MEKQINGWAWKTQAEGTRRRREETQERRGWEDDKHRTAREWKSPRAASDAPSPELFTGGSSGATRLQKSS